MIDLLATPAWSQLDARLRDAAAHNPSSAPQIDAVRGPVITLQQMWRDAIPALAGDPIAAARLRVTLQAASDAAALVPVAVSTLQSYASETDAPTPGLLHHRALAILSAAAVRVTDDPRAMQFALLVVAGLALRCGPAELLARLEPYGAPADDYDNLLRLTVPPIVAAGVASRVFLRGHARDPIERARWRCVLGVFTQLAAVVAPPNLRAVAVTNGNAPAPLWSPASAKEIRSVEPGDAGAWLLHGAFPWVTTDGWPVGDDDQPEVLVVGAAPAGAVVVGEIVDATEHRIAVRFATPVEWIGFVHHDRVAAADRARRALRDALARLDDGPCAAAEPAADYAALVPALDGWPVLEPPPRATGNQVPARVTADGPPPSVGDVDPADAARRLTVVVTRLTAASAGKGHGVTVRREALDAALAAVGRRVNLVLEPLELPWVEDAAAVVSTAPTTEDAPRIVGLFEALARAAARTAGREDALWLALLPGDAPLAVTSSADGALGLGVATLPGLARCVLELLEVERPAERAPLDVRAGHLAVAAHVAPARREPSARRRAPGERLRLVGRLHAHGCDLLEPPRFEVRAAGPSAPLASGAIAVAVDAAGVELSRSPIGVHRRGGPLAFAALVPVSDDVEAVELRLDDSWFGRGDAGTVLCRVTRPRERPRAAAVDVELTDGVVTATWALEAGGGPLALTVELSTHAEDDADWVPVANLHGCARREVVPLWRVGHARQLRIVACDGWHARPSAAVPIPPAARFGPLVIRRVNDRLLWAELPTDGEAAWQTGGAHVPSGRRLELDDGRRGTVELSLRAGDDDGGGDDLPPLRDRVELERGDAYRRA